MSSTSSSANGVTNAMASMSINSSSSSSDPSTSTVPNTRTNEFKIDDLEFKVTVGTGTFGEQK
jgi:hypothetical protein